MSTDPEHRHFKDRLYAQLARIGKTLGSRHRIEMLDLLSQGERTVESVATEIDLSIANASQHLQALKRASLVENRKDGLFVYYRLADPAVSNLGFALRDVAERRLTELEHLVREHFGDRSKPEPVKMEELLGRARSGEVVILDARPANEYQAAHIAGAISIPIDELQERLRSLPTDKEFVAYCRGPYCVYADRAVEMLLKSRRRARRLVGGFPEWRAARLPVEVGDVITKPTSHQRPRAAKKHRRPAFGLPREHK